MILQIVVYFGLAEVLKMCSPRLNASSSKIAVSGK